MKTKMIAILFLLVVILSGCNGLKQKTNQPTPEVTQITESAPMEIPSSQETTQAIGKMGVILNFSSAPGPELLQEQVPSICTGPEKLTETKFIQSSGLVIYDTSTKNLMVLGDMGFGKPIYVVKPKSPGSTLAAWGVSPDGEWLSYLDYSNVYLFDAGIENITPGEKIKEHFEGVILSWSNIYWANDHQIVIPLRNEGDLFEWIVWDPFNQSKEKISVTLAEIGKAVEKFNIFPIYNPNTGTILYACDSCGDYDFQIFNRKSGEISMSIDFGEGPFADPGWDPYFSPGMQSMALYFGGNKIWIFNENGESLLRITMPFVEYLSWTGRTFTWSSDGKLLAMFRETPGTQQYLLSILDIENRTIKNLCAQISPGTLRWSSDNRNIIAMSYRSANDTEGTFSIIDVNTGKGETMVFKDKGYVVGWMKP